MLGTKLNNQLKLCPSTDCTINHYPKLYKTENNIIKHFDEMLRKNRLLPYFLPYLPGINNITHVQYMDMLGIIYLVEVGKTPQKIINKMHILIVNFRLLVRNTNLFGFDIYGLNKPCNYYNIDEIELYHQHIKVI